MTRALLSRVRVMRTLPWWACLGAAVCAVGDAHAISTIASGSATPIEQRVVLAIGPTRSTLWTQARIDASAGPVAVIVPARPGASIDWVTDAWMESLEAVTAPRILPPTHLTAACPGEPEPVDPVDVAGVLAHAPTLPKSHPVEVLDDAAAVTAWAAQHGMTVSGSLSTKLAAMTDHRFVVTRFDAPDGEVVTPTLRVSGPDATSTLPFMLTEAGDRALHVTAWVLGEGRASITGATDLSLAGIATTYDAATATTDYVQARATALSAAGSSAWLTERASDSAFTSGLDVYRDHRIQALVDVYATRAGTYEADVDAPSCASKLTAAASSSGEVAASCPRASLGVVEGMDTCAEVVLPGAIDPSSLRCGAVADDLAVALSELSPTATWLTRIAMQIAPHDVGIASDVMLGNGSPVLPILEATQLDTSECGSAEGGSGGGGETEDASGSGGGPVHFVPVPVRVVDTSCGSREVGAQVDTVEVYVDDYEEPPDAIYVEEDCGGDTADSYAVSYDDDGYDDDGYDDGGYDDDSCSGDTTTSYETYETSYETAGTYEPSWDDDDGDECGGDTTTSYETYETYEDWEPSDTSTDDYDYDGDSGCGGDTYESYETSDWEDDDDGTSSSSDDGCSGDSSESTTSEYESWSDNRKRPRRRKRIRLSKVTMGAAFFLFPLRRLSRRRRRRRGKQSTRSCTR